MSAQTGSISDRYGVRNAALLGALLAAFLPPIAISVGSQNEPQTGGDIPLPSAANPAEQSATSSRWTVSAEGIALQRLGNTSRTLVARVPGSVPFLATSITPGAEAFNSNQFPAVFSAGPKLSLRYDHESGYGAELFYFNIFGRSITKSVGPDNPANWLVMRAPGGFWQTQDFPYQAMAWSGTTKLYNAEVNGRLNASDRVALLAGFRWLQLQDGLIGTLPPPDRSAPTWKTTCPLCDLAQVTAGGPIGALPPFWNSDTVNNLYGVQFGVDAKVLEFGNVSLGGRMRVGLFDNNSQQSTSVSIAKIVYPTKATTNGVAFVSDVAIQAKYRLMDGLSLHHANRLRPIPCCNEPGKLEGLPKAL